MQIVRWYNSGYTAFMKTAISIPDKVFEAAEKAARKLGMSRSELYANAVREYIDRYGHEDITRKLNDVYSQPGAESAIDPLLSQLQSATLPRETW